MQLKPFQEIGRDFLADRTRALLADQMRLGKSAQAITAADKLGLRRILVVCPAIAIPVWQAEFAKWSPEREVHQLAKIPWEVSDDVVMLASYDMTRLNRQLLTRRPWDLLILDECHFAKSTSAQRTHAVLGKHGIARCSDRLWALSGTPAPNHVGEVWPLLRVCGVMKAGYWDYVKRFCKVDELDKIHGTTTDAAKLRELRDILKGFMLRRRTSQVAPELDKLSIHQYPVKPSTRFLEAARPVDCYRLCEQAAVQEQRLFEAMLELPDDELVDYLQRHAESYTAMRRVHGLLKAPAVYETVKFELENGLVDKICVFGYYREAMETLYRLLKSDGFRPTLLFGGTSPRKRELGLERFNDTGPKGGRVFIGQILAAGTAIDLSVANEGIMLEKDWVPGNNAQAMERMGGYNQTSPVRFRDAVLPGPVDDYLSRVLDRKSAELAAVFDEE